MCRRFGPTDKARLVELTTLPSCQLESWLPDHRRDPNRAAVLHTRTQSSGSLFAIRKRVVAGSGAFVFRGACCNAQGTYRNSAKRQQPASLDSRVGAGSGLFSSFHLVAHANLASAKAATAMTSKYIPVI